MATFADGIKATVMTAYRDHFAGGTLEILDGATLLAVFPLSVSGGSVSAGVWTLEFDATTDDALADGTADAAQIKTSGAAADLTGLTVGTSGTDIIIDNASILTGQTVNLTGAQTITHG